MKLNPKKPVPRILVIDDDPAIRRLMRILLEGFGCKVASAETGRQGLRLASDWRPDVVVLELDLPDMGGFSVLDHLRAWSPVPVLILTSRDGIADKVRALDGGANDYVVKPFASEEVAARLRVLYRGLPQVFDRRTTFAPPLTAVPIPSVQRGKPPASSLQPMGPPPNPPLGLP